jgi:homoserine kinase
MRESATAFAPATVANVGIGFDILGHTVQTLGDRVTARLASQPGIRITAITGVVSRLPLEAERNTAGKAVMSLWEVQGGQGGVELQIEKGIPLSSGLGGSAASAVAAVVAANALLPNPADKMTLLKCAMHGEQVASGSVHVDNISPSLFGGLVLTVGVDNPRIKQVPVPGGVRCVLVHPHLELETRAARGVLSANVTLSDFVWQSANLAGFISGCYSGDLDLIRDSFEDVVIERQRQALIPGFVDVRSAAMAKDALGCSISGAGPTVFAWCEAPRAEAIRVAMTAAFAAHGLRTDSWISMIEPPGARIEDAAG